MKTFWTGFNIGNLIQIIVLAGGGFWFMADMKSDIKLLTYQVTQLNIQVDRIIIREMGQNK